MTGEAGGVESSSIVGEDSLELSEGNGETCGDGKSLKSEKETPEAEDEEEDENEEEDGDSCERRRNKNRRGGVTG